jgi:hypothetical protein
MDEIIELLYLSRVYLFWIMKISPASSTWMKANSYILIFEMGFILSGFINFPFINFCLSNPMLEKLITQIVNSI